MQLRFAISLSIALLLSLNLRAALTGPVPAMGNAWAKGENGEMRTLRNNCTKGNNKMDLPAKVGPRGQIGLVEATWEGGDKEHKDKPGKTPVDSAHQVAFTMYMLSSSHTSINENTRLPFSSSITYVGVTRFNFGTGTFFCDVPGVYVFTFSAATYFYNPLIIHLRKNFDFVISARNNDKMQEEQVSGSAVVVLEKDDFVYLSYLGVVYSASFRRYTTFSGFLLYPK